MKVTRNNEVIELTPDELRQAHTEYELSYHKDAIDASVSLMHLEFSKDELETMSREIENDVQRNDTINSTYWEIVDWVINDHRKKAKRKEKTI